MVSPLGIHTWLTWLNFFEEATGQVDEEKAVDVVCLDVSKAFGSVCHKILLDKLLMCGLNEEMVRWDCLGLECDVQGKVYLEVSNSQCTPGISSGSSPI